MVKLGGSGCLIVMVRPFGWFITDESAEWTIPIHPIRNTSLGCLIPRMNGSFILPKDLLYLMAELDPFMLAEYTTVILTWKLGVDVFPSSISERYAV